MRIPIYKSEIVTISNQEDKELQKLLFVILVWAKTNPFGTVLCEDKAIAKWAGLNLWKKKVAEILSPITSEDEFTEGYLLQINYSFSKSGNSIPYYRVLFIEEDDTLRPEFYVNGLEDCVDSFDKYLEDARKCIECGVVLEGNASKYCDKCRPNAMRRYRAIKRNEYYWRDKELNKGRK